VTTSVDARIAAPTDQVAITGALRNGLPWSGTGGTGAADLRWLRYANATRGTALGYVFLQPRQVNVALEKVTRSRRVVRASNPDTAVTRNVFDVSIDQAAGTAGTSLAYALVPNAAESQLRSYLHGRLTILVNSPKLQAVRHSGLGLTAANAFAPGRHEVAGLSIDGPASVIAQQQPDHTTTVAVSDPTMDRDSISVVVHGRRLSKVSGDDGVRVSQVAGGTRLDFTTRQTYGRSLTVDLR
jgi:hyaluronate lyase